MPSLYAVSPWLELESALATGFGDKMSYNTNDKQITIRTLLVGLFITIIMCSAIAGAIYAGQQNNLKDRQFNSDCMNNGGEVRTSDRNGLYCDR